MSFALEFRRWVDLSHDQQKPVIPIRLNLALSNETPTENATTTRVLGALRPEPVRPASFCSKLKGDDFAVQEGFADIPI